MDARAAFPHGCYPLRVEEGSFTLGEHQRFLAAHAGEITNAKQRQQQAFEMERQRWRELGLDSYIAEDHASTEANEGEIFADGTMPVCAPSGASVWKVEVALGDHVTEGQTLIIIETMKMEINVAAPAPGVIRELRCRPGHAVKPGQVLALIGRDAGA